MSWTESSKASDRDYAMSNLERNSNRLREVRTALRRIDAGTFGICVDCERNINPARLAAGPVGFILYHLPGGCGSRTENALE